MVAIDGSVTIVTGAASGLGEATARRFAREGAVLVLADIQDDRGEALAAELGATYIHTDVTRETDVRRLVGAAVEANGRLDCMINNAGQLGALGSIAEIDAESWDATISTLLSSVFYGMKHACGVMKRQQSGVILSTSSVVGLAALGPHAYSAAKHGVIGLTESVASEMASFGVRVNAVAPGNVVTRMTELSYGDRDAAAAAALSRNPLHRLVEADEIAGAFVYLAGPDARNITGHVLTVDSGLVKVRLDASYFEKPPSYFGIAGPAE